MAGTTFTWTTTGSPAAVSGYSDNLASPTTTLNQTLFNSGYINGTVIYHLIPSANGCTGPAKNYTVTVYPDPDIYFSPVSQSVCSGASCNISNLSHVTGTTFTWTATGSSSNVTGFSSGSGNSIAQPLTNRGSGIESVIYQVTPSYNGCQGNPSSVTVTVNPLPQVLFSVCNDMTTTTAAQPFMLKGGTPLGGIYTGNGVTSGKFYPSLAGSGAQTITYSYTNTNGCSLSATHIITVLKASAFTCGNTLTDVRDNKAYPTIQIGTQCWMAANLDYGNMISGTINQRDNCLPEKYCYQDNPALCTMHFTLYQWDELMTYDDTPGIQGLCLPGWHIPTEAEWQVLFANYLGNGFAGNPLKHTGYSGFDALLNGARFNNFIWSFSGFATFYWSSTSRSPFKAWAHGMNTYNPSVSYYPSLRSNAFAVRCLKD